VFTEAVIDLRDQGNAEAILIILNEMYIAGLDRERFRDEPIYGLREWPDYGDMSAELNIYAKATQRMNDLRKDNNGGQIVANVAKTNASLPMVVDPCVSMNVGTVVQSTTRDINVTKRIVVAPSMYGHLEKYCREVPVKMSEEKSVLPVRKEKQNAKDDRATQPRAAQKNGSVKKMTTRSRI
jgi:hypothetical protein